MDKMLKQIVKDALSKAKAQKEEQTLQFNMDGDMMDKMLKDIVGETLRQAKAGKEEQQLNW